MKTKTTKITPARLAVLRQLADGCEAAISRRIGDFAKERAWLQPNGIGKGGTSITTRASTLTALCDAGLIKRTNCDFRTVVFNITEAGRAAVAAAEGGAA